MTVKLFKLIGLFIGLCLLLAGCGGDSASGGNTATPKPSATPFPTFAFVAPTNPPVFNQNAEATEEAVSEATIDPKLIERGLGRYEALECATCHGESGEGSDQAGAINALTVSEEDFITFMRSGGEIGTSHQYSTDRLSASGVVNLYLYLMSLSA